MTKPENAAGLAANPWVNGLLIFALSIGVIFSLGVLVGFFSAADGGKMSAGAIGVGAVLVAIGGLCAWQLIVRIGRLLPSGSQPIGTSQRKVRQIWLFLIGLGVMVGVAAGLMASQDNAGSPSGFLQLLFSQDPVSPAIAALMLAGLVLLTIATIVYMRLIDEHDLAAQEQAALVSINLYVVLFLGWTIAAKGGLSPAVNHFAVFSIVVLTYCAIWLWRKYF